MQTHDTPEKTYDLERLIFFSDGVFAIVITLLVLDLRPPAGWDRTFAGLLRSEWRSLFAYGLTFFAVGAYWNNHRRLFGRIGRFDPGLVLLNFLFLFLVVLLPFSAELIVTGGPRGEPFVIYLGLMAAIGLSQALLWSFAAFWAKVVDTRISTRARVLIALATAIIPILICGAALAVSAGIQNGFLLALPAIAAIGLLRRRLMTPGDRKII